MIALLLLVGGGEVVCRFVVGLGDPPLSVADPEIEYLFRPNQTCRRFGNRIHYNAYSMRSDDFPPHKASPGEVRILVMGDSVVNGGAQTDQTELATSILQTRLAADLGRPVVVGNISAGSWGPPNLLAYARRFGFFDADVVVIVLSSHDYIDAPTFAPVVGTPAMPDHKPILALQELLTRYLPAYLPGHRADEPAPPAAGPTADATEQLARQCLGAEAELIRIARAAGAAVVVAQHAERGEAVGDFLPGHDRIRAAAAESGVEVIDLRPAFKKSLDAGGRPYRDNIHPNAAGQKLIADELLPAAERILRDAPRR